MLQKNALNEAQAWFFELGLYRVSPFWNESLVPIEIGNKSK